MDSYSRVRLELLDYAGHSDGQISIQSNIMGFLRKQSSTGDFEKQCTTSQKGMLDLD
jgi:hypothetical protein